ncbi:MAG: hypothetical protein IK095_07370 [Oscillospiraceae bacterium]|nr:hypothetical protein [Oscillospiraceae bacterium]
MLGILLKKQLAEVFRSFFYDEKKNRMRPKWAIAAWIVLFVFLMVGVVGGMFTLLALALCDPLVQAGMGWLYFLVMGGLAIFLGAFGSVFNTYAGLYLARDNDQLLSLPIPAQTIMAARLVSVYVMGALYAAAVLLPMLIVYWTVAGIGPARAVCGVLLLLIVTVLVLLLSCLLGWVVAKISLTLKHKSFFTVLISLVLVAAYYLFYFRANELIQDLIRNAQVYGRAIEGEAYMLYLFGRIGEGDWLAAGLYASLTAVLFVLIWYVMSRSFLRIVTSSGKTATVRYVEEPVREKGPFAALLGKELGRLGSSANYMLNCCLATVLLPAAGVFLLIKGAEALALLDSVFVARPGTPAVLLCAGLCMLTSMNDTTAPSVSLEGRSLWISQSLPLAPKTVLRAKVAVQLLVTLIPLLFAALCAALVVRASPVLKLLLCVVPLLYAVFFALFGMALGVRLPVLSWTNEIAPIKQSGSVGIVLFGSWGICVAFAGLYLLLGDTVSPTVYLAVWAGLLAVAALALLRWLDTKGAALFAAL